MVFSRLDLQGSCKLSTFFVFHYKGPIDVAFDTVCVSVELLLSCDKLAKSELMLVFVV